LHKVANQHIDTQTNNKNITSMAEVMNNLTKLWFKKYSGMIRVTKGPVTVFVE